MASVYQEFTTARGTTPDHASLLALLRANVDPLAGFRQDSDTIYQVKKPTAWTAPQIQAAQTAIDTAPATSPQLSAQAIIDTMPIFEKAILLTMLDQINTLRTQPTTVFGAVTPAQAIAAVRAKAGTL